MCIINERKYSGRSKTPRTLWKMLWRRTSPQELRSPFETRLIWHPGMVERERDRRVGPNIGIHCFTRKADAVSAVSWADPAYNDDLRVVKVTAKTKDILWTGEIANMGRGLNGLPCVVALRVRLSAEDYRRALGDNP